MKCAKRTYIISAIAYDKRECPMGAIDIAQAQYIKFASAVFEAVYEKADNDPKEFFGTMFPEAIYWVLRLEKCDEDSTGDYCIDVVDERAVIIEEDNT